MAHNNSLQSTSPNSSPSPPLWTPGAPIPTCQASTSGHSLHHALTCSHLITTTPTPSPCGPNCAQPSTTSFSPFPFLCPTCLADTLFLYTDLRYTAHASTLPRAPTLPQYEAWFHAGFAVEADAFAATHQPHLAATHRACVAVEPDGEPLASYREARQAPWVEWALPYAEIDLALLEGEAEGEGETTPLLVSVDAGVWARSGPLVRTLVLRKAYNQRMWLRNGRTWMRRVRVERVGGLGVGWVKAGDYWETVVGEEVVELGTVLGEERRVHLAAMERDLRRDGVVSQQTRDLMRL